MKLVVACSMILVAAGCEQLLGIEDPQAHGGNIGDGRLPDGTLRFDSGVDASVTCEVPPLPGFGGFTMYGGTQNSWFEVGDLDHDGKPDLVIANQVAPALSIYHAAAAGFDNEQDLTVPSSCTLVQTARIIDIDGDHFNDLIVGACNTLYFYRQDSTHPGLFLAPVSIGPYELPPPFAGGIAFGDFDGDGIVDLAVVESSTLIVMLQSPASRGTFGAPISITDGGNSAPFVSLATGDFNRDGRDDLMFVKANTVQFATLAGAQLSLVPINLGTSVTSASAAKLDGVAAGVAAIGPPSDVFLQTATPGMVQTISLDSPAEGKTGVFLDDADGDGLLDIVSDGALSRNCPAPSTPGHAFAAPQTFGEGQMTRFFPVSFSTQPAVVFYSPAAEKVIVGVAQ